MKKSFVFKSFVCLLLCVLACLEVHLLSSSVQAKGIKTSYKRYSLFNYKNEDVLCEPYTVSKDDWLYKIFRKKGEISEKDFPHFLLIFKEINPQISNIDAIEPGIHILIPLKKVKKKDYDQTTPGNIDVPVIEFSTMHEDVYLKPFIKKHTIKKGDTVSDLMDTRFLEKGGTLSQDPNVKNINIVYEGTDLYLPDPSIKSQPWFQSFLSGRTATPKTQKKARESHQLKIDAYKLSQLKKYSLLIGGTLLSQGKMYFPGKNNSSNVLDLSLVPVIETSDGSKILIISGENVNEALLESVQAYWKDLKVQLMSDTMDKLTQSKHSPSKKKNITAEYKHLVKILLSQTGYDYIPHAKIPFTLDNISLEASFGRVVRPDTTDLLINFGNVYGSALEVLEKREFEIISITPKLTRLELARNLFSHLGYTTWENPSFSTGNAIENMNGLYASKDQDKVFIPVNPLTLNALDYLKKEDIKILSITDKPPAQ